MKHKLLLFFAFFSVTSHANSRDVNLEFDSKFDESEKKLILEDLSLPSGLQFDVDSKSWFHKIFNGNSGSDVIRYLEDRVHYLLPSSADITDKVSGDAYYAPPLELKDNDGEVIAAMAAYNLGPDLWFLQLQDWGEAPFDLLKAGGIKFRLILPGLALLKSDRDILKDCRLL